MSKSKSIVAIDTVSEQGLQTDLAKDPLQMCLELKTQFQLVSSDPLTRDILLIELELGSPTLPIPWTFLSPLLWEKCQRYPFIH